MNTIASPSGPDQLRDLASRLHEADPSPSVTVRQLLGWFGKQRRGWRVVSTIQTSLRKAGLQTDPDFTTAYIDGHLRFTLAEGTPPTTSSAKTPRTDAIRSSESTQDDASSTPPVDDPVLRIQLLKSANRTPVTVARDDRVDKALVLMAMHDYSQLPVTQDLRNVDGMISWRSISLAKVKGVTCEWVRDCLEPHEEIRHADPVLRVFRKITDHEVVLVRGTKGTITGIVTPVDLSDVFREQTEPFLLLSEIENQLRRIIDGKFSDPELEAAKDPEDEKREVEGVADLTFGECTRLLEKPDNWEQVGLGLDRKTFVKQLVEVRDIRNDVMHFNPDGLEEDDLQRLKDVRRLLQRVL